MLTKRSKEDKGESRKKRNSDSMPKIIQIGNSLGIVLRSYILENLGWRKGDRIEFEYSDKDELLKVRNLSAEQREYNATQVD